MRVSKVHFSRDFLTKCVLMTIISCFNDTLESTAQTLEGLLIRLHCRIAEYNLNGPNMLLLISRNMTTLMMAPKLQVKNTIRHADANMDQWSRILNTIFDMFYQVHMKINQQTLMSWNVKTLYLGQKNHQPQWIILSPCLLPAWRPQSPICHQDDPGGLWLVRSSNTRLWLVEADCPWHHCSVGIIKDVNCSIHKTSCSCCCTL